VYSNDKPSDGKPSDDNAQEPKAINPGKIIKNKAGDRQLYIRKLRNSKILSNTLLVSDDTVVN
jgi:hypothetical protein